MCKITREKIKERKELIKKEKSTGIIIGWCILIISLILWICPKTFFDVKTILGFNKNFIASGIPFGILMVYLIPPHALAQCEELDHLLERHMENCQNDDICKRYFEILRTPLIVEILPKLKLK